MDNSKFLNYLSNQFSGIDNHFVWDLLDNLIKYAFWAYGGSKGAAKRFLQGIIPEVEPEEYDGFLPDIMTANQRPEGREFVSLFDDSDKTEALIGEVRELLRDLPDGKVADADTVLADLVDECDYEVSGIAQDIFYIWERSTDKASVESMFGALTGCEFSEYLDRCRKVMQEQKQEKIEQVETEAVETCPWCEGENVLPGWNTAKQGFVAKCNHCGREIFLCDECRHAEDNPFENCDWERKEHDGIIEGRCFRGVTRNPAESGSE